LSKARLVGLIGLSAVLAGGSVLSLAFAFGNEGQPWTRVFTAVLGLAFAGVAAWGITYATGRLRRGDPAIAIGPSGLLDTMITASPLPWPEIRRPRIRYSGIAGWRLLFDVDPGAEERLSVPLRQRRSAGRRAAFGAAGYRVLLFGTDATPSRVRAALGRYVVLDQASVVSRILGRD
jgi:hypothetical protein